MNDTISQSRKIKNNNQRNILKMTSSSAMFLSEMSLKQQKSKLQILFSNRKICMLLQNFSGFDDVIIVFVASQPQNCVFKKFNKKWL